MKRPKPTNQPPHLQFAKEVNMDSGITVKRMQGRDYFGLMYKTEGKWKIRTMRHATCRQEARALKYHIMEEMQAEHEIKLAEWEADRSRREARERETLTERILSVED